MEMRLHTVESSASMGSLALWLAGHADLPLSELHGRFCDKLLECGIPLWRSSLGTELLHPEQSGERSVWTAGEKISVSRAPRGIEATPDYLNSPVRIIDETERPYRRSLSEPLPALPLLEDLRREGGTDYVIYPLPFLDRTRSAYLSFTTRAREGFSERHLDQLELATRLISPYAERQALRRIAVDLLDTYVGHHAGARIFSGQLNRGSMDTIEAAILMCDLRGFTLMSKRNDRQFVVDTLNLWFDTVAVAVEAEGGEVLKFMGDGLLAIFRAESEPASACRGAYAATLAVEAAMASLNAARTSAGLAPLDYVIGLHVGEVAYGNVGGSRRLDFTVLGPAVNYASRLQDLAKRLGHRILLSRDFAAFIPDRLVDLGGHSLRGVGRAERIFALPA
jgi:adenylate cyclase